MNPTIDAVPTRRRICWPNSDATCLEGGCVHCNDGRLRSYTVIGRYARVAGTLRNRGIGEQAAEAAWRRGLENGFYGRVEVR